MNDDETEQDAQQTKREKKPRTRVDKAEYNRRVLEVVSLILSGLGSTQIIRNISGEWEITTRQAENYVADARKIITEDANQTRDVLLIEHRAHRRDLRLRAQKAGDFRAELATAQDEAKLLGLYPGDKNAKRFDDMTNEELQEYLAQVLGLAQDAK